MKQRTHANPGLIAELGALTFSERKHSFTKGKETGETWMETTEGDKKTSSPSITFLCVDEHFIRLSDHTSKLVD